MSRYHPILQLILTNIRGYLREPEAIFWTYGFPLLMVVGLGLAFDSSKPNPTLVDVIYFHMPSIFTCHLLVFCSFDKEHQANHINSHPIEPHDTKC